MVLISPARVSVGSGGAGQRVLEVFEVESFNVAASAWMELAVSMEIFMG